MRRTPPTRGVAAALVAVPALLSATACTVDDTPEDTPVISVEVEDRMLADLTGVTVNLDGTGCLTMRGAVVFWALPATWDEQAQAVTFEDADPVVVGEPADLGGGFLPGNADLEGSYGDAGLRVRECLESTGAQSAVLVYPVSPPGEG